MSSLLSPISMIEHASVVITPMIHLVYAASFVIGIYMMGMGGWRIFRYGHLSVEDPKLTVSSIIWSIIIGSGMAALGAIMGAGLLTTMGSATPSPLAYTGPGGSDIATAIVDIMHFMQFLGVLWFATGCRMMYRLNVNQARQDDFHGKAWTHLIGGLGLFDIAGVAVMLANLAGTSLPF
ncbi:hypothetical protein HFU84_08680 [Acidithiobacillus sp. CV18-2]|nr:hypothetical protein [Acidithiobacillus sp. CV18-3]MBU2756967.1 hypothetical protein [Acidithiobacillus sp. BN09-2]MBU2777578.1 hypothetical protein [Acidithiobacillus sp. CV18-2]MBU2799678.1 hypothetical protein [Acidithiobacillus sp. VAN18-4]